MIYEVYLDETHMITVITDLAEIDDVINHINEMVGKDNWTSIRIDNQ